MTKPTPAAERASRSSFYTGMRILPRAQREAMFEIYSFCRAVDDIADDPGPRDARREQLAQWRADIDAVYGGAPPPALAGLAQAVRGFDLQREDFIAIIDGMEMDVVADIRAPDRATLDLYCDRVACAVGRLSVRVFGMEHDAGIALAHHLGRALQLTNILRDLDEDASLGRLYLPREALRGAGIISDRSGRGAGASGARGGLRRHRRAGENRFRAAAAIMAKNPRRVVRAPRIMGEAYRVILDALIARGFAPPRAADPPAAREAPLHRAAQSAVTMSGTVHIIGAGLAGLSAAVRLASRGNSVVVHEATAFAGGRCRSYHDAAVGMTIDNGNHLLLSGNRAALDYLRSIGAEHRLVGPANAEFSFVDLASGERWTLRFNDGPLPFWIFDPSRRVPGTRPLDYLPLARMLWPPAGKTVGEVIACEGVLYHRLVEPLLARGAEHRAAARVGAACGGDHPRDARRRRPRLPAADRARGAWRDADRAALHLSAAARRHRAHAASAPRHPLCRRTGRGAGFRQRDHRA